MPIEQRKDTPNNIINKLELNPFIITESFSPINVPKIVTAKIATNPTLIFLKNPIKITKTKIIKETSAIPRSVPPYTVI